MINIAEILKDCPKGTKLYSPICGECRLIKIYDGLGFDVINDTDDVFNFSYDGRYNLNGECCIFPSKYNRDWNTFQSFEDGDIISNDAYIAIFHKFGKPKFCEYDKVVYYHCWCYQNGKDFKFKKDFGIGRDTDYRLATDGEKQKLFNIIKANGYKWNAETKTLEKLIVPKFNVGDKIVKKDDPTKSWYVQGIDTYCNSDYYYIVTKSQVSNLHFKDQDEWELLVAAPKFKVGDKIKEKNERFPSARTIDNYVEGIGYYTTINDWVRIEDQDNWELVPTHKFKIGDKIRNKCGGATYRVIGIVEKGYEIDCFSFIQFSSEDSYELVPNKFDISTLKAYDKVLVRDTNEQVWVADLFSHVLDRPLGGYTFACVGHYPNQCIPYLGNEHLLGTNNDCDEYFKNW